jgi:flagellin
MRELSVQAANDTLETSDRTSIGDELVELKTEIDRISANTEFNGKTLLDGSISSTLTSATDNVGAVMGTANVSKIDVSSAKVQTYTFSTPSAGNITLTGADGIAQTIAVGDIAANGTGSMKFAQLGIEISLVSLAGETGADIAGTIAGTETIVVGGSGAATFMIGAKQGQDMNLSFSDMASTNAAGINLATLIPNNTAVDNNTKAEALTTRVDTAIAFVNTERGKLGASQNRLEHTIKNLDTSSENLQASESRIRDVDMAKEMMEFTKNNILQQAAQSMLAQANQAPQGVLQLLR